MKTVVYQTQYRGHYLVVFSDIRLGDVVIKHIFIYQK